MTEVQRRGLSTQTRNEISILQKIISRQKEILKGLPHLKIDKDILDLKKKDIENLIYKKEEELSSLEKKINDIDVGVYDNQISTEVKNNTQKVTKELKDLKIKKEKQRKDLREVMEDQRVYRRDNYEKTDKQKERDYSKVYDRFMTVIESVPKYMREALQRMPNNKGYIFRGCWFFGLQKEEPNQPTILFEKSKGIMRIHEIWPHEHLIFEKKGKEQKRLVSRKQRLKKKMGRGITSR